MIYGVTSRDCIKECIGYFTDLKEAEKYCAKYCLDGTVYEIECLQGKENLSEINVAYVYKVIFVPRNGYGEYEKYQTKFTYYEATRLHPDKIIRNFMVIPIVDTIEIEINLFERDENRAEKIAQDYIDELAVHGNGRLDMDYIELMNLRFKRQREHKTE